MYSSIHLCDNNYEISNRKMGSKKETMIIMILILPPLKILEKMSNVGY